MTWTGAWQSTARRIAAALVCVPCVLLPAAGQERDQTAARGPAETVVILGRTYRVKPLLAPDEPGRPWAEVRDYFPRPLLERPAQAPGDEQVLQTVERLAKERADAYGAALDALTDRHLANFLKRTPEANWDWFNLELAGMCLGNQSGGYIPDATLRLCQEYQAANNLVEMLRASIAERTHETAAAGEAVHVATAAIAAGGGAGAAEPLSTFKDCDSCPEMVALPPGKFLMGASKEDRKLTDEYTHANEIPQHEVTIGYSFAIGKFEVTVAEFGAYVAETGTRTGGECQLLTPDVGPQARKFLGTLKPADESDGVITVTDADFRTPGAKVTDKHPATCISRREAMGYLEWLRRKTGKAYRLPTEAEWEYAVRAGSMTPFHYGRGPAELCNYGNFADRKSPYLSGESAPCAENPSPVGTAVVGSYQTNAWGLHDMIGNAFEFVEDCSFDNYRGAPADGSPWRKDGCENFVQRSYDFENIATALRSAARCLPGDWDGRSNALTIRVALSLDDTAWDRR